MLRRPPRSTLDRSSAASDVYKRQGKVNPRDLYFDSYFLPVTDSINQKYFEPLNQQNILGYLRDIQPKSDKYLKLQTALRNFNSLLDEDWIKIALTDSKIKVGDNYSAIDQVGHRLIQLGLSLIHISEPTRPY